MANKTYKVKVLHSFDYLNIPQVEYNKLLKEKDNMSERAICWSTAFVGSEVELTEEQYNAIKDRVAYLPNQVSGNLHEIYEATLQNLQASSLNTDEYEKNKERLTSLLYPYPFIEVIA